MTKRVLILMLLVVCVLILSGCFPREGGKTEREPAGFFTGIWHGWIAPISLIAGLFNQDIRIYETINTGWWYDFGYYIAIIAGFGGIALSRKKKKEN
ncbi:MAG: hypothetical protein V1799_04105 [bacterium]